MSRWQARLLAQDHLRPRSIPQRDRARLRARRTLGLGIIAVFAALPFCAASAGAASPAPKLAIHALAIPTNFSETDNGLCESTINDTPSCDGYQITVTNVGSLATDGTPIELTDVLPDGLAAKRIRLEWSGASGQDLGGQICEVATLQCTFPLPLQPDAWLKMTVLVTVEPGASGALTNLSGVTGGGTPADTSTVRNQISSERPAFGPTSSEFSLAAADGKPDRQAGGHPYELRTRIDLNSVFRVGPVSSRTLATSVEDVKDVVFDLPLGVLGSAVATPTCTLAQLSSATSCPPDTAVGTLVTEPPGAASVNGPLFNITPEHGVAAEFGYVDALSSAHIIYARLVPTAAGYLLRATAREVPQIELTDIVATFFGDPAAKDESARQPAAMFTNSADCSGQPLLSHVYIDSWQNPGGLDAAGGPELADPAWTSSVTESPPVSGCNLLRFNPTIGARPETAQADTPTGLAFSLDVPQSEDPGTLATPPLRRAVITLPAGLSVNASAANGLAACSLAQIGMSASGVPTDAPPACPKESRIGNVEVQTPLLPGTLSGSIYLARQTENPFGSLLAIYLVVDDPTTGIVVKIPGEVRADPASGQLQAVVDDNPQFPFSALHADFFGGPGATLKTPATCGRFEVGSQLTPWSAPDSGAAATPSDAFEVDSGAGGAACASTEAQLPNTPSFEAGTVTPLAGAYSPFVLKLSRGDGSQELTGIDTTLPKGLLGRLAGVPYCPDAALAAAAQRPGVAEQASPSCPSASQVGVVDVGAGAGPRPFHAQGKAYLAGPYRGAPLSLAIITPAVAGPFDLGTVVVRTALNVDPFTAQIHAVSDPFPHILQGIPLDIRSIALTMDRPNFTLNPTSCDPSAITGGATSLLGNVAPLTQRFQVGGCGALKFKPQLKLSLKGSTRHAGHPALRAVLTYPKGGGYANIARAQVNLPHSEFIDQANLNKTCTRPVLLAGNCPASSIYGRAKAWSPLLDQPLSGPVYLVGGFGYKLPAMVAELDGQIRVLLVGKVDSGPNKGIRNTFEAVPDAPVERFELNLKGGPKYSLLENSENLCARPQRAIARFTAQNGAVLQSNPLIANQCGKKAKKNGAGKKKHKGAGAKK